MVEIVRNKKPRKDELKLCEVKYGEPFMFVDDMDMNDDMNIFIPVKLKDVKTKIAKGKKSAKIKPNDLKKYLEQTGMIMVCHLETGYLFYYNSEYSVILVDAELTLLD